MRKQITEKLVNIFFLLTLFLFINAFNFKDNPLSGWYQQFLPNISSQSVSDMLFLDSLNGFLITESAAISDTAYILKTTNGGDNWAIKYRAVDDFSTIKFANSLTGFVCAGDLYKTTNAGENWFIINAPNQTRMEDMSVLNTDTFWVVDADNLTGGVFRTTNGGTSWTQQLSLGSQNPNKIYFYNAKTGFVAENPGGYVRRTTDGGANWTVVVNNEGFTDMHFVDSLTGWKSYATTMKKTSDGGLSWINQPLPQGGYIVVSRISSFSNINKDTIWGGDGFVHYPNNQERGMIYTTTNGGNNWYYQVPDTSINIYRYYYVNFTDKLKGWAYAVNNGIHTKVGGDPITSITQNVSQIPSQFRLEQNYPNPFNPLTRINYELQITNYLTIKVYDLRGKEIAILINEKKNAGSYSVSFDASKYNLSSGIYFYSLYLDNKLADTKKMILVK